MAKAKETPAAEAAVGTLEEQPASKTEEELAAEAEHFAEVEKQQAELEPTSDEGGRYVVSGQPICVHDKLYNPGAHVDLTEEEAATLGAMVVDTQQS